MEHTREIQLQRREGGRRIEEWRFRISYEPGADPLTADDLVRLLCQVRIGAAAITIERVDG